MELNISIKDPPTQKLYRSLPTLDVFVVMKTSRKLRIHNCTNNRYEVLLITTS